MKVFTNKGRSIVVGKPAPQAVTVTAAAPTNAYLYGFIGAYGEGERGEGALVPQQCDVDSGGVGWGGKHWDLGLSMQRHIPRTISSVINIV
jgi:hypothetical protein